MPGTGKELPIFWAWWARKRVNREPMAGGRPASLGPLPGASAWDFSRTELHVTAWLGVWVPGRG